MFLNSRVYMYTQGILFSIKPSYIFEKRVLNPISLKGSSRMLSKELKNNHCLSLFTWIIWTWNVLTGAATFHLHFLILHSFHQILTHSLLSCFNPQFKAYVHFEWHMHICLNNIIALQNNQNVVYRAHGCFRVHDLELRVTASCVRCSTSGVIGGLSKQTSSLRLSVSSFVYKDSNWFSGRGWFSEFIGEYSLPLFCMLVYVDDHL